MGYDIYPTASEARFVLSMMPESKMSSCLFGGLSMCSGLVPQRGNCAHHRHRPCNGGVAEISPNKRRGVIRLSSGAYCGAYGEERLSCRRIRCIYWYPNSSSLIPISDRNNSQSANSQQPAATSHPPSAISNQQSTVSHEVQAISPPLPDRVTSASHCRDAIPRIVI